MLLALVAFPGVVRAEFWKERDWKDHDHQLTVCVKTAHCPTGFVDSVHAAVDLWNAKNLSWHFDWKGTDCDHPDIVVDCLNLPFGENGKAVSLPEGSPTVNHVDITIKSNGLWGFCNEHYEIVSVIAHELGHAMRLKDLPTAKQGRVMRGEQLSAGHDRGPSPEDAAEAEASDSSRIVTTGIIPKAVQKQTGAGGTIVPAPGTWPFDFQRAINIVLRAFNPLHFQILNYQPIGPNTLSWQGFVSSPEASMELYHLIITYPESTSVREGLLYVTDVAFQPGWAPNAVAPPDTMVSYDTDDVILYPYLSSHPAGDVTAFRWIVDGAFDVQGMGGEASVKLAAGLHQVILVAEDEAGGQDRDTMLVNVLATNVGVPPAADARAPRLVFPVPFLASGAADFPIRYELPAAGEVNLTIYDMQGHVVRVLRKGEATATGPHTATWDLRYRAGMLAPAGTYLCALRFGAVTVTRKLVIIR